jgi:hypothetical protein
MKKHWKKDSLIQGMMWFVIFLAIVTLFPSVYPLSDMSSEHAIIAAYSIRALCAGLWFIAWLLMRQQRKSFAMKMAFKAAFNVDAPESKVEAGEMHDLVSTELIRLAKIFRTSQEAQEEWNKKNPADTPEALKERRERRYAVETDKAKFWAASDAAQYFGIPVKKFHADWLK